MDEELNRSEESTLVGSNEERQDEAEERDGSGDAALLQEIREYYSYYRDSWADPRKESQTDRRYLSGDPWPAEERKARKDASRPCINHDELNQYVFQGVNNLRQSPRGVKIEPRGNGASAKTAELRQDIVRTIEYRSHGPTVYLKAAQHMFEGGIGYFRISRRYVHDDPDPNDPHAWDQEIVEKPLLNPDSVLYDPDCKELDWSDATRVFVLDPLSVDEFKRRFPNARKTDFNAEDLRVASDWIQGKNILVAEFWKLITTRKKLLKKGRFRWCDKKRVVQYITNGVEILEENPQLGTEIPIVPMVGLERYVPSDDGSSSVRHLISLVRFAREPQMSLAYLATQEMEEAGMTPKVPVMGYTGQFDTDRDAWETLNKVPHSFVQVDAVPDPMNPTQVLPLPQWRQFTPNFQAYEVAKDGARRAIQAAIGVSPLPTSAQRQNEKSGIALERIQTEQAIGSYHFVEGYERGIERGGRIIDSWMAETYDNEREMALHQANDTRRVVTLNTEEPYPNPDTQESEHHVIGEEEHDVSVSTAPSMQSQRDEVGHFLDNLIANIATLPIAPPQAAKLLAMAIKMKNMGPQGDEMADIISPEQGDQGQALQGLQQQFQQQQQAMQAIQGELQQLRLEKQGKVIDNEYRAQQAELDRQAKLAVAEITTKAQALGERIAFVEEFIQQQHAQAHEAGMQAADQAHQQGMAADAAAQQQAMQQQQQQQPGAPGQQQPA